MFTCCCFNPLGTSLGAFVDRSRRGALSAFIVFLKGLGDSLQKKLWQQKNPKRKRPTRLRRACEAGRGATRRRRTLRSTRRSRLELLSGATTHTQRQHTQSAVFKLNFKRFVAVCFCFVLLCLSHRRLWLVFSGNGNGNVNGIVDGDVSRCRCLDVDVSLSMLSITITGRNMRAHHANVKQKLKTATAAATSQRGNEATRRGSRAQTHAASTATATRAERASKRANEWQCKARRNTQPNTN